MIESNEPELTTVRDVVVCVLVVGALIGLGSLVWSAGSFVAIVAGVGVATLHLLAVAYLVRAALSGKVPTARWVLLAVAKLGVMLIGLGWLVKSQLVPMLPFLLGYAALPIGVTVSQLGKQVRPVSQANNTGWKG